MPKKDFTMKFPAPNIKGSKNTGNQDEAGSEKTKTNDPEKRVAGETAASDQLMPGKINKVESNKTESKARQGKNLADMLTSETMKTELELGENPFLQSKERFDPASVIKTGYKMRVDYKTVLKLMAELKKGYTIEALLDDALTMYLGSSPEAKKAIQMMRLMK